MLGRHVQLLVALAPLALKWNVWKRVVHQWMINTANPYQDQMTGRKPAMKIFVPPHGGKDHGKNVPKVVGKGFLFAQCSV